jgi:hypothetical protein
MARCGRCIGGGWLAVRLRGAMKFSDEDYTLIIDALRFKARRYLEYSNPRAAAGVIRAAYQQAVAEADALANKIERARFEEKE